MSKARIKIINNSLLVSFISSDFPFQVIWLSGAKFVITSSKNLIAIRIQNLNRPKLSQFNTALKNINFDVKFGEIFGIAGVAGNGQVELSNVICGIQQEFNGKVLINSNDVSGKGVKSRKKLNLSYIPENRLGVGLAPGVSVLDNSAIREYFKSSYGPHLSKGKMLNYLNDLIKQFSIKAPDVKAEISTFIIFCMNSDCIFFVWYKFKRSCFDKRSILLKAKRIGLPASMIILSIFRSWSTKLSLASQRNITISDFSTAWRALINEKYSTLWLYL